MNTTVRPYRSEYFKGILELFLLNTPQYFHPDEQVDLERYLTDELENYYIIAEDGGEVLACGGNNIKNDTGYLSWYIVHPDFQGMGLGTALVKYNLEYLKGLQQLTKIKVRTSQLVYPFYAKAGFRLLSVQKDYWGAGFDLYEMELSKG